MNNYNDIKLENCDSEDIADVILKIEKSFEIKSSRTAFKKVVTFGDLCDVILSHINYDHETSCTKQQAFYKIRTAIAETQLIDKNTITPSSRLTDLFPKNNRRKKIKELRERLGCNISFFTYPGWLALILFAGLVLSIAAFFVNWQIAVTGICFFVIAFSMAEWLKKDFEIQTVEQMVKIMTREHYVTARRKKNTVNRHEILDIIKESFSNDLSIEREQLTKEAKLY